MLDLRTLVHDCWMFWNGNQWLLKHSKTKYRVVFLVTINPRLAIRNNSIGFSSLDDSERTSVNLFALTLAKQATFWNIECSEIIVAQRVWAVHN